MESEGEAEWSTITRRRPERKHEPVPNRERGGIPFRGANRGRGGGAVPVGREDGPRHGRQGDNNAGPRRQGGGAAPVERGGGAGHGKRGGNNAGHGKRGGNNAGHGRRGSNNAGHGRRGGGANSGQRENEQENKSRAVVNENKVVGGKLSHVPAQGSEAGGGGASFQGGGAARICQQQTDPNKPPQAQPMAGMQSGINFPTNRSTNQQYYSQRAPAPRVSRGQMMSMPAPPNLQYQSQTAALSMMYHNIAPTPGGVIIQYPAAPTQRHQPAQQAGTNPSQQQSQGYYAQQPLYVTTPQHHQPMGATFAAHQYPTHPAPQYVFQPMRSAGAPYTNHNAGHPMPPQQLPQQPPQQFVDPVAAGTGVPPSANAGVMLTPGPPPPAQPGPPQPIAQKTRRSHAIPIIDPNSGKDLMDEILNEKVQPQLVSKETNSSIMSNSPTPVNPSSHVAAEFAARVAAVATEPSSGDEEPPAPLNITSPNNNHVVFNSSNNTTFVTTPIQNSVEVINHSINVVASPQLISHPAITTPVSIQPQTVVPSQPSLGQSIPTVSAMTNSPSVELPRPKTTNATVLPNRKATPMPANVTPVIESSKKKDKKIIGIPGGSPSLPSHKEEVEPKMSSFAESFNLKNISSQCSAYHNTQSISHQIPAAVNQAKEIVRNGEVERLSPSTVVVTTNPMVKSQEKNNIDENSLENKSTKQNHDESSKPIVEPVKVVIKDLPLSQHESVKAQPKQKAKKKSNLKELNRRGQEKEGGTDMDAFMVPTTPTATTANGNNTAVPIEIPKVPLAPTVTTPLTKQSSEVVTSPVEKAAQLKSMTPPAKHQENDVSEEKVDTPLAKEETISISLENVINEEEVVEKDETAIETESIVVTINKENSKLSDKCESDIIHDSSEDLIIENTEIETSKAPVLKFNYKEDQWSPINPEGKKVYDREFLLGLRTEVLSTKRPDIEDCDIIRTEGSTNNISNNNVSTNNNRRLYGSNSMSNNRDSGFAPGFLRGSSSQRGGVPGKRGSQQGRPMGGRSGKPMYSSNIYRSEPEEELHWAGKSGWKPDRCKSPTKLNEEEVKTANLYKKFRGILNKLTPQKFETLLEQITALPIDTLNRLEGVVKLVFDKAVDEPSFSKAYAALCFNLAKMSVKICKEQNEDDDAPADKDKSFRKVLLTRCQEMFEKKKKEETGEDGKKSDDERIEELRQSVADEEDKDKKKELLVYVQEEERKIRVKYVGLARFIGELFKLNMLTPLIMHSCISTLLEKIEEESLECLCKLLTTVGKELETRCYKENKPEDLKATMDGYFNKMRKLANKTGNSKVSSRVRFMLLDVIDLRTNRWVPRRDENNPKTMDQIQKEAERETLMESALLSSNASRPKHNDRDDRRRGPRGSNMNNQDSEGWSSVTASKTSFRSFNIFEPSKLQNLKGLDNESSGVLGSHTQFSQWNSGSNSKRGDSTKQFQNKFALLGQDEKKMSSSMLSRKAAPSLSQEKERAVHSVRVAFGDDRGTTRGQGSNPPSRDNSRVRGKVTSTSNVPVVEQEATPAPKPAVEMDSEEAKNKSKVLFEEWLTNRKLEESIENIQESFPDVMQFVHPMMEYALEVKTLARASFTELLVALLSKSIVTSANVTAEFSELLEFGEDLMIDLPLVWTYFAEILGPLMVKELLTFSDMKVACKQCNKWNHLTITLSEVFKILLNDKGPVFTKNLWESSQVQFTDFFPESEVEAFIESNICGFLTSKGQAGEPLLPMDQVEDKLLQLLESDNSDKILEHTCEWIKVNVGNREKDADFIKALTRAVFRANIKKDKHLNNLGLTKHEKILKRFVDANESRELACLHSIQNLVVVEMLAPQGLLLEIFRSLWENNIISHDAFMKWKSCDEGSKYETEGKGVAIKSLSPFFVSLSEQDETDEDSS